MSVDCLLVTEGGKGVGLGHAIETLHLIAALKRSRLRLACLYFGSQEVSGMFHKYNVSTISFPKRFKPSDGRVVYANIVKFSPSMVLFNVMELPTNIIQGLRTENILIAAVTEGTAVSKPEMIFDIARNVSFMIINPAISRFRKAYRIRKSCRVLVTMGGFDAKGLTVLLVEWLAKLESPPPLSIVVGKGFSQIQSLRRMLKSYPSQWEIYVDIEQLALYRLMQKSDLAFSHGGDTLYELACIGVPSVVLCPSTRQENIARIFSRKGNAINLGLWSRASFSRFKRAVISILDNNELRQTLSTRGRRLIDGKGVERIASTLKNAIYDIKNN